MKILYLSAYPIEHFDQLEKLKIENLLYASQKFNSTFIQGFKNIGCDIEVLCARDILTEQKENKTRLSWKTIKENDINYLFPPTSSNKYIRKLIRPASISKFAKNFFKNNPDGIVLMDNLCPCAWDAFKASKRTCSIVTDLTNDPEEHKKHAKMYNMISQSDYIVFLTNQMKEVIDLSHAKKNIVIQGVIDAKFQKLYTEKKKVILYSGAINDRNGLLPLMEAFKKLDTDYELHFYGKGPTVQNILEESKNCPRIKYMGTVSSEEIARAQQEALIAVNPEAMNHSFATYSFPSKLLVYLSSGAATISTKLPCIPEEMFNVLEAFDSDSVDDIYNGLNRLVHLSEQELIEIGKKQQEYVYKNYSNTAQAQKVIDMIKNN